MSNYDDVYTFHKKFGLIAGARPQQLTQRKLKERVEFMLEELEEFATASELCIGENKALDLEVGNLVGPTEGPNFADQADALIDLVYVAMGTAVMMGLPWQQLWDDVQRANMSKVRGMTKRGHAVDVTKPEGWIGPDGESILFDHGYDPAAKEVDDEQFN